MSCGNVFNFGLKQLYEVSCGNVFNFGLKQLYEMSCGNLFEHNRCDIISHLHKVLCRNVFGCGRI